MAFATAGIRHLSQWERLGHPRVDGRPKLTNSEIVQDGTEGPVAAQAVIAKLANEFNQ